MKDTAPVSGHGRWCNAQKRQGPGLCRKPAGWGTSHAGVGSCRLHGGSTGTHRTHSVGEQAKLQLARMDVAPVADPLTALAEIAGQVVAFKDAMAQRVNQLSEIRFTDERYAEQLRSEVAVFERALDRCERFLSTMARLKIDDRLAAIEQQRVDMVAAALTATLVDLGLSEDQQLEARRGVAARLRLVAG